MLTGRRIKSIAVLITICLLVSIIGCVQTNREQLELNKELVYQFKEALNTSDWEKMGVLLTEDFLRHSQATTEMQVTSRQEMIQLMQLYQEFAPDQKLTLDFLIAEGDKVAGYGTYSGTNTGPMGDLPPTGRSFELLHIGIFRIENGRIAEQWVEWDNLAILTQLGLFPPPSQ
jgi:steroid delta-isomerase-like uncharacterized protein